MTTAITPPADHDGNNSSDEYPGRGRTLVRSTPGRKRKRQIYDENFRPHDMSTSNAPALGEGDPQKRIRIDPTPPTSTNPLDRRPDLSPEASRDRHGARSITRSPSHSPLRKHLNSLPNGSPPILVRDGNLPGESPDVVGDLNDLLATAANQSSIPSAFREQLDAEYRMLESSYSDQPGDLSTPELLQGVRKIFRDAHHCKQYLRDENAWIRVVETVLKVALHGQETDWVEDETERTWQVQSVQTQSINEAFIPKLRNTARGKKSDVAINYSLSNAKFHDTYKEAGRQFLNMSHFSDTFTQTVPVGFLAEVKTSSGSLDEATLQIAISSAAAIAYLDQLKKITLERFPNSSPSKPQVILGWTVVGHEWRVWIAWRGEDGAVYVHNPPLPRPIGTLGYLDIFALIAVLRRAVKWLDEEYFPGYLSLMRACLGMTPPAENTHAEG